MEIKYTERGFAETDFDDLYGNHCSIQKSSASEHVAVWVGIDHPEINILIKGKWKTVLLPDDVIVSSRMHLDQEMVKQILPILEHFAETGELPDQDTLVDAS